MKKKKIKVFKSVNNICLNTVDFSNKYNFLLVTGLSGSGKSTYAKKLAQQHNATIITLDGFSQIYKNDSINECTKKLINDFIKINPILEEELKVDFWHRQKLNNFERYKYWNILFFEFLIENIISSDQLFIIEGTQIFMTIDTKMIKKYPIIVVGTSDVKSFFRRINRQLTKNDFKKPFSKGFKHLAKLVNDSKRLHFKDYKKLNKFLSELQ